ncbi:unnamed protein product [Staurois parvus]|uniref:Uncharacterized protein n=1 Tax=Staurois parvus TaxID=386267 RepID=A0ABN9ATF2_9NEOB|nr:unnamed protein product [Staurois parvus]
MPLESAGKREIILSSVVCDMADSAVDLRITAHFTHLGSHGGQNQSVEPQLWRWRQQQWEAHNSTL